MDNFEEFSRIKTGHKAIDKRFMKTMNLLANEPTARCLETMENASAGEFGDATPVFLGDRESDLYEYFEKAVRNDRRFIARRIHNRKLKDTENIKTFLGGIDPAGLYRKESLRDSADTVPLRADCGHSLKIPRDSHTGREAREAKLEVKYGTVLIPRPQNAAKDIADALQLQLISAVEIDAPEGIEAISWQLISNLNVDSYETARTYINWYSKR
ncbi:MAG: hypothetical protein LBB86_07415, partial [Oscillospiraceae bacterium]|nr:hypothetical protein [Oscillospiraceae bacterium]